MSGPLSDVVSIQISATTVNPTRAGFGKALILSWTAAWAERVREYSSLLELAADFATTTAEYKAAAKYFAQNPRPESVFVGRAANKPSLQWEITPTVINNYKYELTIDGLDFTYTSDGSATAAEITGGLKTAFDLLGKAVTSSQQATNTVLRLLANTAGAYFSVGTKLNGSNQQNPNLLVVQNQADPGVAADLDAILLENTKWYALITTGNSKAVIDAAGAWCETNFRLYPAQTQDTPVINTPLSGNDDVGESTKANALTHTGVVFSQANGDFADAAWLGKRLPTTPGSETWKFAQLATVTQGNYSTTQRANMVAKNVNFYEDVANVPITQNGTVASGAFLDFTRYIDFLKARIAERVFTMIASQADKVPYDDRGIGMVEAELRGQLAEDEKRGAIEPGWSVRVPKSADVSAADRAARVLNDVEFTCQYSGAIHKVIIGGVVLP